MDKIWPWLGVIIGILVGLVIIFALYKLIGFLTAKKIGGEVEEMEVVEIRFFVKSFYEKKSERKC